MVVAELQDAQEVVAALVLQVVDVEVELDEIAGLEVDQPMISCSEAGVSPHPGMNRQAGSVEAGPWLRRVEIVGRRDIDRLRRSRSRSDSSGPMPGCCGGAVLLCYAAIPLGRDPSAAGSGPRRDAMKTGLFWTPIIPEEALAGAAVLPAALVNGYLALAFASRNADGIVAVAHFLARLRIVDIQLAAAERRILSPGLVQAGEYCVQQPMPSHDSSMRLVRQLVLL